MSHFPVPRRTADPAQVKAAQAILGLPQTGILCRRTIAAAAVYTRSWHRGPSLVGQVLEHRTSNAQYRTSK